MTGLRTKANIGRERRITAGVIKLHIRRGGKVKINTIHLAFLDYSRLFKKLKRTEVRTTNTSSDQ